MADVKALSAGSKGAKSSRSVAKAAVKDNKAKAAAAAPRTKRRRRGRPEVQLDLDL